MSRAFCPICGWCKFYNDEETAVKFLDAHFGWVHNVTWVGVKREADLEPVPEANLEASK